MLLFFSSYIKSQGNIEAGALIQPQVYGQFFEESMDGRQFKIPYSFAIGINVGYNITDNFGFRTGFIYSPQGDKYVDTSLDPEVQYDLKLDYIKLPLYIKINASTDRNFSPLIFVGPHLSFLNNAEIIVNDEKPESVLGDYERILIGASANLGFQYNLDSGGNINVIWRIGGSLNDVQSENGPFSKNINTGFQLAYHYFIQF